MNREGCKQIVLGVYPSFHCPNTSRTGRRWEPGYQPVPHHVDQRWRLRRFSLLVRQWRLPLPPDVSDAELTSRVQHLVPWVQDVVRRASGMGNVV